EHRPVWNRRAGSGVVGLVRGLRQRQRTGRSAGGLVKVSIRHVWIALTIGAAVIGSARPPIGLPDLPWTLLDGQCLAGNVTLITTDPFTSAPHISGQILNLQWLADLTYHAFDAIGGLPGVITGTAVVVATTYGLLLMAAATASGYLRLSCVAVWAAYVLGASN